MDQIRIGSFIRELFDGERKKMVINEMEETMIKAAEYSNAVQQRMTKVVCIYFITGLSGLVMNQVMLFMDIRGTFRSGFL